MDAVSNPGTAAHLGALPDSSTAPDLDTLADPATTTGYHRLPGTRDTCPIPYAGSDDRLRATAAGAHARLRARPGGDRGTGLHAATAGARLPAPGSATCPARSDTRAAGAAAATSAAQPGCAAGRGPGTQHTTSRTADRACHPVTVSGFCLDDTIAAIATPLGEGGIGIVKISGPRATEILHHLFTPTGGRGAALTLVPRRLTRGHVHDPRTGQTIDEVLAVLMPAPHSYTCQDVVEIQTHGGIVVVQRILELVLAAGARPAAPGEMTLRAFLNGRLDLAQAEAVLDIVKARTEAALRVAVDQLGGHLSRQIKPLRSALMNVLAYLEATIDFVEDEIPPQDVRTPLHHVEAALLDLLATADRGMIYRQGARAAIVGRPNVGKSSLLNALLRGDRAIVTPVPGTTRDTLEETINLHGVPLVLVDTAGIRLSADNEIEQLGIERSRAALQRADLALLVIDGSQPLDALDETIAGLIGDKAAIVVVNKRDLPASDATVADRLLPDARHVAISALTGTGLSDLEQAILDQLLRGSVAASDTPLVSNPRHKAALARALDHVHAAQAGEQTGLSTELLAIDVRAAVDELGEITGETAGADLIEAIFSQFCLGK